MLHQPSLKMPACLMLVALAMGCAGSTKTDPRFRVEGSETPTLQIADPVINVDGDTIILSGVVRRQQQYQGPTPGFLYVLISSKEGSRLQELYLRWNPADIPTTGKRESEYRVRFGWVPPKGSVVTVSLGTDSPDLQGGGAAGAGMATFSGTPRTPRQPNPSPRQPTGTPRQPGRGSGRGR